MGTIAQFKRRARALRNFAAGYSTPALEGTSLADLVEAVRTLLDEKAVPRDAAEVAAEANVEDLLATLCPEDHSHG
jgi:hypothetical protein